MPNNKDVAQTLEYAEVAEAAIDISEGVILVFSVANKNSFQMLPYWIERVMKVKGTADFPGVIVGTHTDKKRRVIAPEVAARFAKENRFPYMEYSSKKPETVTEFSARFPSPPNRIASVRYSRKLSTTS